MSQVVTEKELLDEVAVSNHNHSDATMAAASNSSNGSSSGGNSAVASLCKLLQRRGRDVAPSPTEPVAGSSSAEQQQSELLRARHTTSTLYQVCPIHTPGYGSPVFVIL